MDSTSTSRRSTVSTSTLLTRTRGRCKRTVIRSDIEASLDRRLVTSPIPARPHPQTKDFAPLTHIFAQGHILVSIKLVLRREAPAPSTMLVVHFGVGTSAVDQLIINSIGRYGMYESVLGDPRHAGNGYPRSVRVRRMWPPP